MDAGLTRRRLLSRSAAVTGVLGGLSATAVASQSTDDGFSPAEHGYGFRNWSTKDRYFAEPRKPSPGSIRERIRTEWADRLRADLGLDVVEFPQQLVDTIATQLRTAVVQRAGTNGHCYGMVLTAQQYFEDPTTIPVEKRVASEIESPVVPVETPEAPVYDEIVQRQADQFLKVRSWMGRRAALAPERIDTAQLLRDVESVVEAFGTATLTLLDGSIYSHQVLAWGFERDDDVRIPIYDPNRPAELYSKRQPALRFVADGDDLSMRPYGRYTSALYNRYDQIERATDRADPTPLDHLTVGEAAVRESLFPVALFTVDTTDASLVVSDPNGEEIDRIRGRYMDRSRGEYTSVRSRYGAPTGTYQVDVLGKAATQYQLDATVVGLDGTVVDTTRNGSLDAGERHEYELTIDGQDGSVDRTGGGRSWPALAVGAGVAGGLAAGALAHRRLQGRSDGEE